MKVEKLTEKRKKDAPYLRKTITEKEDQQQTFSWIEQQSERLSESNVPPELLY